MDDFSLILPVRCKKKGDKIATHASEDATKKFGNPAVLLGRGGRSISAVAHRFWAYSSVVLPLPQFSIQSSSLFFL